MLSEGKNILCKVSRKEQLHKNYNENIFKKDKIMKGKEDKLLGKYVCICILLQIKK